MAGVTVASVAAGVTRASVAAGVTRASVAAGVTEVAAVAAASEEAAEATEAAGSTNIEKRNKSIPFSLFFVNLIHNPPVFV